MTKEVGKSISEYISYDRKPLTNDEEALFLNKFGKRIGEHYVRNHFKECAFEAEIYRRVYPHMN